MSNQTINAGHFPPSLVAARQAAEQAQQAVSDMWLDTPGGTYAAVVRAGLIDAREAAEEAFSVEAEVYKAAMTDWGTAPSDARWYGCVIYEGRDGETTYTDGYSAAWNEPDPRLMVRSSLRDKLLEVTVKPTPGNAEHYGSADYPSDTED